MRTFCLRSGIHATRILVFYGCECRRSALSVKGLCSLRLHRKTNWIADRMKKLIKPRGGGREGRAVFTAAGSVENLADAAEYTSDPPKIGEASPTIDKISSFTKICSHAPPLSAATGAHMNHLMTTKCRQSRCPSALLRSLLVESRDSLKLTFCTNYALKEKDLRGFVPFYAFTD